ncbi:MAG: DUF3500 domain-containing protein [Pirellulales bacterium]
MTYTSGLRFTDAHFGILLISLCAIAVEQNTNASEGPASKSTDLTSVAGEMAEAASNFYASLNADQQRRVVFNFKDEERRNFHFFPIPRRGVALKEMNSAQQSLAYALLSTGLGAKGFQKAATIMSLGQILRELDPDSVNPFRDSDQYYLTIFGKPALGGTWGWRVEGFHLSVNFTIVNGRAIASAPSFFGSIPALVKEGPRKGLEVLRQEEGLGQSLALSLDADQRKIAFSTLPIFEETVGGLLTGNKRKLEPHSAKGLPAAQMTAAQAKLLMTLIREYAHHHRPELASQDLSKIAVAGPENIHFSWAGGMKPGEPHHYMVQGPTFLIEFDNTQDDANHVHTVWRDFKDDFGDDLLRRHYLLHHGHDHRY